MENEIRLITEYLDKIGVKLGVGVGKVWPWFVKQQYIDSIIAIVSFLFFASGFIYFIRKGLGIWDGPMNESRDYILTICCIVFGIGTFLYFMVFMINGFDFINVEYWALKDLIRQIR